MPATSQSQQRLFGQVHAYQQGKLKNPSSKIRQIAGNISDEDAGDFARTKHKGLPSRKEANVMSSANTFSKSSNSFTDLLRRRSDRYLNVTDAGKSLRPKVLKWGLGGAGVGGLLGLAKEVGKPEEERNAVGGALGGAVDGGILGAGIPLAALGGRVAFDPQISQLQQFLGKQSMATAVKAAMVTYLRGLAERVPIGTKAADIYSNTRVCKRLYKLAAVMKTSQDIFKAVDLVYSDKSATFRHRVIDGLVRGFRSKIAAGPLLQVNPQVSKTVRNIGTNAVHDFATWMRPEEIYGHMARGTESLGDSLGTQAISSNLSPFMPAMAAGAAFNPIAKEMSDKLMAPGKARMMRLPEQQPQRKQPGLKLPYSA